MLRKYLIFFTSLILSYSTFAQNGENFSVEGKVLDAKSDEPLELATVTLLNPQDSGLVAGNTTNANGNFTIKAEEGDYLLKIQFVSYQSKVIPDIDLGPQQPNTSLGTITLKEASKNLSEVVVEGERSRMTMERGKKIFNVGTDLSNSGASAADVLDNIPAVQVDIEGNVSLRGQGVRILVNGKPSGLIGVTGNEALRYFPANQIEEVEVITNPSAKYEAEGSGGIINIILKENMNWGFNGTFTLEGGIPKDHGASANVNFRNKWYNIFANYSFNVDRSPGGGWRVQDYNYPDTTYTLRTDEDRSRGGVNHRLQFGSDFYFTPYDILKVSGVMGISDQHNYNDITYKEYNGNGEFTQKSIRNNHEREDEEEYELNLNYEKTFEGNEDHKLTADFQFESEVEVEDADLEERQGEPYEDLDELSPMLYQHSLNNTDVITYMGKADYTLPIGEEGEFLAGLRGEIRDISNYFMVEQRDTPEEAWQVQENFTNNFLYGENIYGVYSSYSNKIGNITYKGGVRFEYTATNTLLEKTNDSNKREYVNLFPSGSFTYEFSRSNSLQLSYSRRLDRPYFRELNPFANFEDDRRYRTGNPNLDPEFTDSFDFGYVNNLDKSTIYIGSFFRHTTGEIEDIERVNENGITYSQPQNLAVEDDYGVETRYSMDVTDWWNFNVSAFFFRSQVEGSAYGEDFDTDNITMFSRASTRFDIPNWFELQISGDYDAPEEEPQGSEEASYEVDLGLTKEFFDGRGNLTFSVRDLFNTDVHRSTTRGENFTARSQFRWRRGQQFSLSFAYEIKDKDSGPDDASSIFGGGGIDD